MTAPKLGSNLGLMKKVYKDENILIDEQGIEISNYYFPLGKSKFIPWQMIKSVKVQPLTMLNGKYRVWGMGLKPYWFNSDWRAEKNFMFVIDSGSFIKSAITPDDFDSAKKVIAGKTKLD